MVKALTISRTKVMRSYREASHQTYRANSDIVKGWIWHSALGPRTCAACWARHGTVHSLEERLDDYIRGGSAVPLTKTWAELGFHGVPQTQIKVEKGFDLFARLPDADKEAILGKAAFLAYKSGAVKLGDFVGRTRDRRWGTMRYAKSLVDILGRKERDKWIKEAVKAERMKQEPNRLIRALLDPKRMPTEQEIKRILDHMAQAPFATRPISVDKSIRGQMFQGRPLGKSEPSIVAHLAKRVLVDGEWASDVSAEEYLSHLYAAATDRDVRMVVHRGEDGRLRLGLFAPNRIPRERLGGNAKPFLWVVYLADYGTITTGFQVKGIESLTLPKGARWL